MINMDQKLDGLDQENATKIIGYVKKAAEMTHTAIVADKIASKATAATQTQDKSRKWMVIQEYLKEYGKFINKTSLITGVCVCSVNSDFYDKVTLRDLDQQLRIIVGIVYLKEAVRVSINVTYKECLKMLLRKSNILTEAQLNLL
jgi:roadblock/LC7 domain-containing protein